MKRSFFAALALGWSLLTLPGAPAHAQGCGQGNPNCVAPTPPLGNNTNRIATTAFVQGTLAGGLPLTQSSIFIGNGSNFAQGSPVTGDCVFTFLAGNALARCIGTSSNGQLLRNNAGVIAGLTAGALTRTDDTNVTLTLGGTPASALVNAASITVGWTGTLAAPRGGTGFGSYTIGDLLYADTANSLAKLPDIATGNVLLSGGVGAPPSWGKVTASSITAAALTKADDTNVTLTLGGSPSLALVNAASITAGWTGTLAAPRGGTGFGSYAVGDLLYADTTTSLAKLADIAVGNVLLSGGIGVAPAWGKVTAASITAAALTKADDTNVTLTLGGAPTTALVNAASITAGWTGQLGLTRGGSAASLTASNGGIVYSTASAMAILAGTATARLPLLSGASTTPQWGAYTLPASVTSGGIPYFSSTSAESSSALLAQNGVMVGGGAGAAPATVTAGTNGQLLVAVTGSPPAMATMSADATISNAGALTLAPVNANTGSWGTATQVPQFTVNAKGLITAAANVTVTPAIGSVTGLGTGVATLLGTAVSTAGGPTTTIAAGTSALGTSAIGSGACATVVTTAATNTATTDVVTASFNGDPTAVTGYIPSTGGMLTIIVYPTANNVNFKACNNTSSSITPGAITLNWRVVR